MPRLALVLLSLLPAAAAAEPPRVAADIAPVHALVAQVMQGVAEPALVVRPGTSPHGHAMRPSEAAALEEADLVVWTGAALTPWLQEPLETLSSGETLELLSVDGTALLPLRDGDGHAGRDHAVTIDPHAWLDPDNARLWLSAIADALAAIDPDNAATYRRNAEAGRAAIDAAGAEAEAALAPHRDAPFVVYHDAYQYLESYFGLSPALPLALSDAAAPPPARVAQVAARLRESGARCVFAEPQFSPGLIDTVTEGTETRVAVLDPVGSDLPPGPSLYPDLIRGLAGTIADCAATAD